MVEVSAGIIVEFYLLDAEKSSFIGYQVKLV
jgi:hypothetical protein